MKYFFLSYGFIYLALLFYFLHKTFNIFKQKLIFRLLGYLFCVGMIMLPFLHASLIPPIYGVSGWLRLGFLFFCFLFCFFGVSIDIFSLIFTRLNVFNKSLTYLLTISAILYGTFEAQSLKLTQINLVSSKFSKPKTLKLAFISDLHLGVMSSERLLEKTITLLKENRPEVLICGGDILDGNPKDIQKVIDLFNSIKTPLGKYCVLGNHESYFGKNKSSKIIESFGFKILRDETATIKNDINILGLDYLSKYDKTKPNNENALLANLTPNNYNILIKHTPVPPKKMKENTDLMLAGHTHNGQVFPFVFFVKLLQRYIYGLYAIDDDSVLYVSSGSGFWEIPVRIFARPEIVIINITSNKSEKEPVK